MTLNEYIEQLQKLAKQYPDAVLIYASDNEGNSFGTVWKSPSVMYFNQEYQEAYDPDSKDEDFDFSDYPVAICIN
jgi:hypothetical protein